MVRYWMFGALVVGIGLAAMELGRRGAEAYERMLAQRVTNGLELLGFDWAEVRADGLRLEIHGHAPNQFARDLAYESAVATAPAATVVNYATAILAPPERRDPVRVELLRDLRGVTLTGQTASRDMRDRLNQALARQGPHITVFDLTGIQAEQPPRGWGVEIDIASLAASRLPNAYVVMQPGRVAVDGQVPDEAERAALSRELRELAGTRVALTLNLRIPQHVIAPFAFSARKDPDGTLWLERCAARTPVDAIVFEERMESYRPEAEESSCEVGLGGPSGDWAGAVLAGLDAIDALKAGRLDIEYRAARLTGLPPTSPDDFAAARDAFLAALPEGFAGTGKLRGDDVVTRTRIESEQHWLQIVRNAKRTVVSGLVPDENLRRQIETYAAALLGSVAVESRITSSGAPSPAEWDVAALRVLDVLADTSEGEARLAGYTISLSAKVPDTSRVHEAHRALTQSFEGYAVRTLFEVDVAAQVRSILLPVGRCAIALNDINSAAPIEFDPGSATIAAVSGPVLDAMADVLRRCQPEQIEVGGHTDSQGREEMNVRLSRDRAGAVVAALEARGIPAPRLLARGYGEAVPVADNETEEGRALNRRIEFQPAVINPLHEPTP